MDPPTAYIPHDKRRSGSFIRRETGYNLAVGTETIRDIKRTSLSIGSRAPTPYKTRNELDNMIYVLESLSQLQPSTLSPPAQQQPATTVSSMQASADTKPKGPLVPKLRASNGNLKASVPAPKAQPEPSEPGGIYSLQSPSLKREPRSVATQSITVDDITALSESDATVAKLSGGAKNIRLVKVIIIGSSGVGKTSFVKRVAIDSFEDSYKATLGIDMMPRMCRYQDNLFQVSLWDTAGSERFDSVSRAYYRSTHGAFVVFDVTNRQSFLDLAKYNQALKDCATNPLVCLVGNKIDLGTAQRQVSQSEARDLAAELNYHYFEVSARTGEGVFEAFLSFIRDILREKYFHIVSTPLSPKSGSPDIIRAASGLSVLPSSGKINIVSATDGGEEKKLISDNNNSSTGGGGCAC